MLSLNNKTVRPFCKADKATRVAKRNEQLKKLYANPLPSTRSGALYNAFAYPTKISPEAVAVFIACHTKPGDLVLDTFAGSGSTGLGTLLCSKPTLEMERIAKELGASPVWGPRRAVLYEVGVLGAFVSRTMCNPPDPQKFETAALQLLTWARNNVGHLYEARDPKGNIGEMRHIIWTDIIICPQCKAENRFLDVAVKDNPLHLTDEFVCSSCKHHAPMGKLERANEKVLDPLIGKTITRKKRVPGRIYGKTNGTNWMRAANATDLALIKKIESLPIPSGVPVQEIQWGELYRSGYHTGISHVHHFYTRRNLIVLTEIWKRIDTFPTSLQDSLRLLVLSYNTAHSTLMTRVVIKNGENNFILTGAQSGVLYISSLPVEKNILRGLQRKIKTLNEAFAIVYGSRSEVSICNASSTKLRLPDTSVHYVFTDPPFGDYIPYAEINQIAESWLGKTTDRRKEIIVSPSQHKEVADYEEMMAEVFGELGRVLKPNGKATVAFHSAKASIWNALTKAYTKAGFSVRASSILDKLQTSFKQTVSEISVKGDPLFLLDREGILLKSNGCTRKVADDSEVIIQKLLTQAGRRTMNHIERGTERLYSRYVARCLELRLPITLEAEPFYKRMRARKQV